MKKNSIDIINLGCSKNLVDSEKLSKQLEAVGYTIYHDPERLTGEVVIINTCGFIGDAKEESINTILECCELKRLKKVKQVLVMGCLSERYMKELEGEIPEVDKYYGKFDWPKVIEDLGKPFSKDISLQRTITTPSHYAYLKISEGCNRSCSYCAIPIITGKHKSRPIEEIEAEVRWLTKQGVKEFNIIAQDLSYYGFDLYHEYKLAELTERIADIKGVEWIRLHYAYPAKFPFDVLKVIRERDNVCKYLDIALQHVSDNVLTAMRRNFTKAETYSLIDRIREEVPGIHIRTTLMVGHPGEGEREFDELKEFVSKAQFERMGVFPYSEEEGTYSAKHYKDETPEEVKQERADTIMEMQRKISYNNNCKKIGSTMKVIIDRQEQGYFIGRSEFDSPEVDPEIRITANDLKIGNFYNVRITECEDYDLIAELTV